MSDICDEAGVSRGTLYRYFANRDEVLAAVRQQIVQDLRDQLAEATRARPAPDERVSVVLQALAQHTARNPAIGALLRREPALALEFLTAEFGAILTVVTAALRPALKLSPPVVAGVLSERQAAELLLRVMLTFELVPSRGSSSLAARIATVWDSLLATGVGASVPMRRAS